MGTYRSHLWGWRSGRDRPTVGSGSREASHGGSADTDGKGCLSQSPPSWSRARLQRGDQRLELGDDVAGELDRRSRVPRRRTLGDDRDLPAVGARRGGKLRDRVDLQRGPDAQQQVGARGELVRALERSIGQELAEQHHVGLQRLAAVDRKSTRLNSSHEWISYAVF